MAVYFRGMSDRETTDLTLAMAASGDQLDLHDSLPPGTIIFYKQSRGGVGLMLEPPQRRNPPTRGWARRARGSRACRHSDPGVW